MAITQIQDNAPRLLIGISACLTGQQVRFNGQHKRSRFCLKMLEGLADLRPVCPEVAIGLGTPRPPIRLVATDKGTRAQGSDDSSLDVSERLDDFGRQWAARQGDLDGFILAPKSPSCGMERVKVYRENGYPAHHQGTGFFARALQETQPLLPVEEEGRLHDPRLRENFFTRCYAYRAWRTEVAAAPSMAALVSFHARNKYLLMAHDPQACTRLGRLIGGKPRDKDLEHLAQEYIQGFMKTLKKVATRRGHTNVLLHLMGYLKGKLQTPERDELLEGISGYHQGMLPLVVPLRMLRHYLQLRGSDYAREQRYLQPHPQSLGLYNAI